MGTPSLGHSYGSDYFDNVEPERDRLHFEWKRFISHKHVPKPVDDIKFRRRYVKGGNMITEYRLPGGRWKRAVERSYDRYDKLAPRFKWVYVFCRKQRKFIDQRMKYKLPDMASWRYVKNWS